MEKLFEVIFEGKEILGVISLPNNIVSETKVPCIIMCYGFNGSREETNKISVKFAREISKCGIACVRFDYLGCSISSGEFYDYLLNDRINHTKKVVEFIKKFPYIDSENLGVIGFSDGCKVALGLCDHLNNVGELTAMSLWSPVIVDERVEGEVCNDSELIPKLKRNPINKKIYLSYLGLDIHPKYFDLEDDLYFSYLNEITNHIPTLCVFGEKDNRNYQTKKRIRCLTNGEKSITELEINDATHLFESKEWVDALIAQSREFFINRLTQKIQIHRGLDD